MSKLSQVYVASFDTGVITGAGDYPTIASGVFLPTNARVLRATLTETTALAGLTNVRLFTGSGALTAVLALGDIDASGNEVMVLTGFSGAGELKLTTTGVGSGGSRAKIHVEYVLE